MEQRPLRLGDVVDDYCPREKRVTNHVVSALLGEAIKQTRCSTCDAEHAYKGARVPARRKKNDVAALETAVLASVNGTQLVARVDPTQAAARPSEAAPSAPGGDSDPESLPQAASEPAPTEVPRPSEDPLPGGWMGHRTLIRASLPRTEGEPPPARPIPEFTMHQRQTRGSHAFRNGQGWPDRGRGPRGGNFAFGNGNGPERNGNVNGNSTNYNGNGNGSQGGHHGPGNGPGRPPGHGRRHRHHGKHRRSH